MVTDRDGCLIDYLQTLRDSVFETYARDMTELLRLTPYRAMVPDSDDRHSLEMMGKSLGKDLGLSNLTYTQRVRSFSDRVNDAVYSYHGMLKSL